MIRITSDMPYWQAIALLIVLVGFGIGYGAGFLESRRRKEDPGKRAIITAVVGAGIAFFICAW